MPRKFPALDDIPRRCDRILFKQLIYMSFFPGHGTSCNSFSLSLCLSQEMDGKENFVRLSGLGLGQRGVVRGIDVTAHGGGIEPAELERRLLEMGFVEGALVTVLHEGLFGRDPMAVRLDDMRVALRRRDAQVILLEVAAE